MGKRTYRGAVYYPGQYVRVHFDGANYLGPYKVISTRMGGAIVKFWMDGKQIERHASCCLYREEDQCPGR